MLGWRGERRSPLYLEIDRFIDVSFESRVTISAHIERAVNDLYSVESKHYHPVAPITGSWVGERVEAKPTGEEYWQGSEFRRNIPKIGCAWLTNKKGQKWLHIMGLWHDKAPRGCRSLKALLEDKGAKTIQDRVFMDQMVKRVERQIARVNRYLEKRGLRGHSVTLNHPWGKWNKRGGKFFVSALGDGWMVYLRGKDARFVIGGEVHTLPGITRSKLAQCGDDEARFNLALVTYTRAQFRREKTRTDII